MMAGDEASLHCHLHAIARQHCLTEYACISVVSRSSVVQESLSGCPGVDGTHGQSPQLNCYINMYSTYSTPEYIPYMRATFGALAMRTAFCSLYYSPLAPKGICASGCNPSLDIVVANADF